MTVAFVRQPILANAAYFLPRELCSRVSDTDRCQKRGQNLIPEGKIGPKTNEFLRRLRPIAADLTTALLQSRKVCGIGQSWLQPPFRRLDARANASAVEIAAHVWNTYFMTGLKHPWCPPYISQSY
jgi:hypothetical protein